MEFSALGRARTASDSVRFGILPRRCILFHPKPPSKYQVLYKVCALLGYRITTSLDDRYDVAVNFQPVTHADPAVLADLANVPIVINRRCTDVSKTRVQEAFAKVFGYPLGVDPVTYPGWMVVKSDENYRHDGRVLQGPIESSAVQKNVVYQRALWNEDGHGHIVDLRVPIYRGRVPLVYMKIRRIEDRFGSINVSAEIREAAEVFSESELSRLALLGEELGVDFAEMDVIRDNGDGLIYVVDVNNTPAGPAKGLRQEDRVEAINRLSRAFEELVQAMLAGSRALPASRPATKAPLTSLQSGRRTAPNRHRKTR